MITEAGCPICEELEKQLPTTDRLKYLDASKDDVTDKIADELGIRLVPTVIELDGDDLCVLNDKLEPIKCVRNKNHSDNLRKSVF